MGQVAVRRCTRSREIENSRGLSATLAGYERRLPLARREPTTRSTISKRATESFAGEHAGSFLAITREKERPLWRPGASHPRKLTAGIIIRPWTYRGHANSRKANDVK